MAPVIRQITHLVEANRKKSREMSGEMIIPIQQALARRAPITRRVPENVREKQHAPYTKVVRVFLR